MEVTKKFILTISLCLLIAGLSFSQTSNEQIAFDYFFEELYNDLKKDLNICKINFSGFTETELSSYSFFKPCFEDEESYKALNKSHNMDTLISKRPILYQKFSEKVKFRKSRQKYSLNVFESIRVADYSIVQINLVIRNKKVLAYYFRINNLGQIIGSCKTGLVY